MRVRGHGGSGAIPPDQCLQYHCSCTASVKLYSICQAVQPLSSCTASVQLYSICQAVQHLSLSGLLTVIRTSNDKLNMLLSLQDLLDQCLAGESLDTAVSYLVILQNLQPLHVSRVYIVKLLEAAIEQRR